MRFGSIKAKGLGPFREEISVDLDAITQTIVAVTGANGAGKSTLLELLAGGLYRACPTRGPLAGLATARDAFLEVEVVNGSRHRVRHVVDAVSGKGESVVTDETGRPLVTSAKLKEFDAWAAKHLPPPEVLYASTFAAQGSGGFLDMKPGERKAVLLRVLGIERLEGLAERAREHVRSTKSALAIVDARISDERARASDPIAIAAELDKLVSRRAEIEQELVKARAHLEQVLAEEERAKNTQREIEDYRRRRDETERKIAAARAKRDDLAKRLENNRALLARKLEIREAQTIATTLDAEIAKRAATIADLRAEASKASSELTAAKSRLADLTERAQQAGERLARAVGRLADKATIELAAASLPDMKAAVAHMETSIDRLESEIRAETDLLLHGADRRISALRAAHASIADGVAKDPRETSKQAIVADDHTACDTGSAPKKRDAKQREVETLRTHLTAKRRELASAERTAARTAEIAAAEREIEAAKAEIAKLEGDAGAAALEVDDRKKAAADVEARFTTIVEEQAGAEAKRRELDAQLKQVERLTSAEARVAELQPQHDAVVAELAALEESIAALVEPPAPVWPDTKNAQKTVDVLDAEHRSKDAAIAVKEAQLSDARAAEQRLRELESERQRVLADLSDWSLLAEDLGRDGLQALEIDAAGPELTELTNDLLRSCVGSRWTVTIEASRLSADGKKTLEGCEVRVLDTERGREGTAESLSGGERVLVGEAVSLALSMLACRRSGVQGPTLVRDESGAALDPVNARAYVAMLRRAAELVGASKVLFVSHSEEVQALADARIEVKGGRVHVAA